jgi:hypothetical protein
VSGYRWSAPESRLPFSPRIDQRDFRALFTASHGWGVFAQKIGPRETAGSLELRGGTLEIARFGFAPGETARGRVTAATAGRQAPVARGEDGLFIFEPPARLAAGERLEVRIGA